MTVINDKNIRVPITEIGSHTDHTVSIAVVNKDEGIKGVFCLQCKKFISFLFNKKQWEEKLEVTQEISKKFIDKTFDTDTDSEGKFIYELYEDGFGNKRECKVHMKSDEFKLCKDIEAFTLGLKVKAKDKDQGNESKGLICPDCGKERDVEGDCKSCGSSKKPVRKKFFTRQELITPEDDELQIIKLDPLKQIVYGVFLVPEKADHHGDVISLEDVEKVAHKFLVEYRAVDEMHHIETIKADVIESAISWKDGLDYRGKTLTKGTWFGAIKIHDREVWEKVLSKDYKAFSVRIAGIREPIEEDQS